MRRRVLTAILGVTAAALIILGVPLGWAVSRVYRSQQLTRLQQAATVAAAAVPAEGLHGADPIEPPTAPAGIQLSYYDTSGVIAAGGGPARADRHATEALAGHPSQGTAGSRLSVAVPITANEITVGSVEASSARAAVAARTVRAWLSMAVLGMLALAIAALIAVWSARRLSRPVDSLVSAAARLGDGDFALNAPKSGIAELDRAGAAIEATSARLGGLMNRERAFTAHASHQLRTPLTALRLDLENALETPGVDTESSIADAIAQVDRLQETLEQLLALARTGSPAGHRIALGEILAPLQQRWHPVLAQQGRRLRLLADESILANSAPASLAQILDILLDNATSHGQGTVEVLADAAPDWVRVDVQDEGDGIMALPETVLPRHARTATGWASHSPDPSLRGRAEHSCSNASAPTARSPCSYHERPSTIGATERQSVTDHGRGLRARVGGMALRRLVEPTPFSATECRPPGRRSGTPMNLHGL